MLGALVTLQLQLMKSWVGQYTNLTPSSQLSNLLIQISWVELVSTWVATLILIPSRQGETLEDIFCTGSSYEPSCVTKLGT